MSSGLRERKKQRTRESIQDNALRLYREQGYTATTLEQVAAAAEVSLSTLFRYFPTKPDTVLYDRVDPIFFEAFVAQPEEMSMLAAARHAIWDTLHAPGQDHFLIIEETRMSLMAEVPELRAAAAQKFEETMPAFLDAVARRSGRDPGDPEVRYWAGALGGVVLVAVFQALSEGTEPYAQVEEGLRFLENGLRL